MNYTFFDTSLLLGSLLLAVAMTTVAVTVLLRRRKAAPVKPWLKTMLKGMEHADNHRGRINPVRLGIEKM